MLNDGLTLEQLDNFDRDGFAPSEFSKHYDGPTKFHGFDINSMHSPNRFVRTLLKTNQRTGYTGVAVIAPPGHGKTTLGQMLLHLIHEFRPLSGDNIMVRNWRVEWAGSWEFSHQLEYYESLPKSPTVIIYDDISGVLEQMSDSQINECFEALTTVRHILGEENNVIVLCLFHYTKILQKDFRAQLQYKVYLGMGDEEQTNIKHTYDKKSGAYKKLMNFAKIYQAQMEGDGFYLKLSPHKNVYLETDKPFRCSCVVTLSWTEYMLFTKMSCERCRKKESHKKIIPMELYNMIKNAYGRAGIQGLKYKLYEMGYPVALGREVFHALHFINRLFKDFSTDWEELERQIVTVHRKERRQKRFNVLHKEEDQLYRKFMRNVTYGEPALAEIEESITNGMNLIFDQ